MLPRPAVTGTPGHVARYQGVAAETLTCRCCLRARVVLGRARLELEADEGLISYHPGVMTRLDHVSVARPDLCLGSVLVCDMEPAGLSDAHVPDLAAVRAHDRLHALRPLPARLERHAGSGGAPTRITSTRVLSGVRVSSGESKSSASTPAIPTP